MEQKRLLPLCCSNKGLFDKPGNISVYLRREITKMVQSNILKTREDLRHWLDENYVNAQEICLQDEFFAHIRREIDTIPEAEAACASLDKILQTTSPDLYALLEHGDVSDPNILGILFNLRPQIQRLMHLHPLHVDEVRLRVMKYLLKKYHAHDLAYRVTVGRSAEMLVQSMQCGGYRLPQIRATWDNLYKEVKKQRGKHAMMDYIYPYNEDRWERTGALPT